jgi:Zn-finger nucleic acid-binding protein
MTCPNCGAPRRLKADQVCFTCDYCSSIDVPDINADGIRVFDEPAELTCPVCTTGLMHAVAAGQRMLYCNVCHGMLISMGVFPVVIEDLKSQRASTAYNARPFDPRDLDRRLSCPKCGRQMDTHLYGGGGNVVIDDCENCGLNWLDYGELERIVRAPDREYVS